MSGEAKRLRANLKDMTPDERREWYRGRVERDPVGALTNLCVGLNASAEEEADDLRGQLELCKEAIGYVLERAQTNRDFGYQTGPGTQAFRLLVRAEAAILGEDPAEHEAKRSKQYWPADEEPA